MHKVNELEMVNMDGTIDQASTFKQHDVNPANHPDEKHNCPKPTINVMEIGDKVTNGKTILKYSWNHWFMLSVGLINMFTS